MMLPMKTLSPVECGGIKSVVTGLQQVQKQYLIYCKAMQLIKFLLKAFSQYRTLPSNSISVDEIEFESKCWSKKFVDAFLVGAINIFH